MNWFLKKFSEPSTWRGIGGLVISLGLASVGQVDAFITAGAALMSLVEVIKREN